MRIVEKKQYSDAFKWEPLRLQEMSGKRNRLDASMEYVHKRDTLIVPSYICVRLLTKLTAKGVHLHLIAPHIATSEAARDLLFTILGAISRFDTEMRA